MGSNPLTMADLRGRFVSQLFVAGLLATSAPVSVIAQNSPARVVLRGVTAFDSEELQLKLSTIQHDNDSVFALRIAEFLQPEYSALGYFSARVDSVHSDTLLNEVYCRIAEGDRSEFGIWRIRGLAPDDSAEFVRKAPLQAGAYFSAAEAEESIQYLLSMLERKGFAFARASIASVIPAGTEERPYVNILLNVVPGDRVAVKEVKVTGLRTTRESVVVREVRLEQGATYTADFAEAIRRRLLRMRLFSAIGVPQLYLTETGEGGIEISVTEQSYNRFDGVVGYVPPLAGSGAGYVTGMFEIQFRNLFGTARKFLAKWSRENQSTSETAVRYAEPWIASLPVNAELAFSQRKQDSSYIRTVYEAMAELSLSDQLSLGGSVEYRTVVPGAGSVLRSGTSSLLAGVSVMLDARNDPLTPTEGWYHRSEFRTGPKSYTTSSGSSVQSSTQRLMMDAEAYYSPFRRHVTAFLASARVVRADALDIADLFRFGGATTLRGYVENMFMGSTAVWGSCEYRLLVERRSFAYAFLDAGYYDLPASVEGVASGSSATKYGYGVGIRLETAVGLLGVSFALGSGDSFSTGKIHFRLINDF